jgi:HlyD family secretion protein
MTGWVRAAVVMPPLLGASLMAAACNDDQPLNQVRASGYVEATEVRLAPDVGGRILEIAFDEGDQIREGDLVARLDDRETTLTLARVRAERQQAEAQLRLLRAGPRPQDVRQADAQVEAAAAEHTAARAELAAAEADLERFEALLRSNSGSRKQRDDAATAVQVSAGRVKAAEEAQRAARESASRVKAGARSQEIDAARARVAAIDAEIASVEKTLADTRFVSPVSGIVTERLADPGEVIAARAPVLVVTDLAHAWANVFIDEPLVPRLRLGQPATLFTDAGGAGIPGKVTFISPKAEFTPRNVQTAEERSKLVYRIKISADNSSGVLKQGMPIEAEVPLQPAGAPQDSSF